MLRLNCYDVGRAGQFGADYRFISTVFGGMPSACVVLVVTGVFLAFSFGEISRTVAHFGIQLAVNAIVASVVIVPIAFVLLYVPLRISSLFALCYGVIGILCAPILAISGFWPVNIFSILNAFDPAQFAYLSAWTITTLAYWAALPLFFVIARFGVRSLLSSHRTHIAIRTPLPKPWRPLSALRYIFGVQAAYGWSWPLLLARAFFAAGLVCFFYSLYGTANKLGLLTETCYLDETGRTISLGQVRQHYHECLLGIDSLMGGSLLVLLNAGMGVLVGIAGVFIGRELYRDFLTKRHNAYSEYGGDILFLRPFNEDARTFRDNATPSQWAFFDLVDQAENFARLLDQTVSELGRTVAVGSPTRRSTGGLTLEEVSLPSEEWRLSVSNMAEDADAIVFVDGEGEGIAWERNMLLSGQHVGKTLFLMSASGDWRSIQEIMQLAGYADESVSRKVSMLSRKHIPVGVHIGRGTVRLYYSKTFQMSAYHTTILDFCNFSGLRAGTRLRNASRPNLASA